MRITGGRYRSRALKAPRGQATRPTSDRVREALFAILGARGGLEGARVLDLYAGTGALALEALSRGAASATLVERGREALEAIRANVGALGVGAQVRVVASPVERAGRALEGAGFDLIFVDPPYAAVEDGSALRAVEDIVRVGALAAGGTLILEHAPPRGTPAEAAAPALESLICVDARRYGDTCLSFYERSPT